MNLQDGGLRLRLQPALQAAALLRRRFFGVGIARVRRPGQFDERHDPPTSTVKLADDAIAMLVRKNRLKKLSLAAAHSAPGSEASASRRGVRQSPWQSRGQGQR